MATIGKVRAVFTASTSGLVAGVNQAAASMRKMESSVASLRSGVNMLVGLEVTRFFADIVQTASGWIRTLINMGEAQAQVIDQQSKLAARVGMTYGEFAGLALAGELAGVGMDTVAMAASKADIAFVKARNGSAQAQKAFAALGLSLDDLAAMSAADRFEAIAAAIAKLPTEAEQAAAAVALFGRAGMALLPMFQGGADSIAEAREQAERLGLALTNAQGRDVEAMNDAFTLAYQAVKGIVGQVTAYLAPAIKGVVDTFTKFVGDAGGVNIGRFIGDALMNGAIFLAKVGDWLVANLSTVWQYVGQVGTFWAGVVDVMARVGEFLRGVFNVIQVVMATQITMIAEVVARLAKTVQMASYASPALRATMGGSIDAFAAGAEAFVSEMRAGIVENANQAGDAFGNAFGDQAPRWAPEFGELAAGPMAQMLMDARASAQSSAESIDEAGKGAAAEIADAVAASPQAVKGIDSRSSEGISEMFRIMRGMGNDAAERTAEATERSADFLEDMATAEPFLAMDIA